MYKGVMNPYIIGEELDQHYNKMVRSDDQDIVTKAKLR